MTERERLIELLKEADKKWFYFEDKANYLLENGVIVPPVKVGDTIYTKYKYSFKVESIEILKDKKIFRCGNDGTDDYTAFYEDEIGTEVFLTREEMEKVLAKETAQNGLAYATPNFELLEG